MIDKDGNITYDHYDAVIHRELIGDAEDQVLEVRGKRIMEDANWAIRLSNEIRELPETSERS